MSIAARFMALFAGSESAHGTYKPPEPGQAMGKVEIKTSARTMRAPVTEYLWAEHLAGRSPLGVIPIRDDDTALWGCIDIDRYDVSHAELVAKVARLGLTLWVGKSKSGGAHVFLFSDSPVPAIVMQRYLRDLAARVGVAGSEIFPKQTRVMRDRAQLGNWMIMPYFGHAMACVRPGGGEYTAEEFVSAAERGRVPAAMLGLPAGNDERGEYDVADGPPCLQHLRVNGFPEGSRNKGLFALGVYAKKRWPNNWEEKVEEFNRTSFEAPLSSEEVLGIITSLRKRDYQYTCKDFPLVDHCNSALCRRRSFGIGEGGDGGGDSVPHITSMSVLDTDPPLWFVDLEEDTVELNTEQLLDFRKFQRVCAERLLRVYPSVSNAAWAKAVGKAMESVVRVESPIEVGVKGMFTEALESFLTNRQRGKRPEDILSGRPWENEAENIHIFQLTSLADFLDRNQRLRGMTRGMITQKIKDLGGGDRKMNIKGKFRNCWWVPSGLFSAPPEVDSPPIEPEVM